MQCQVVGKEEQSAQSPHYGKEIPTSGPALRRVRLSGGRSVPIECLNHKRDLSSRAIVAMGKGKLKAMKNRECIFTVGKVSGSSCCR